MSYNYYKLLLEFRQFKISERETLIVLSNYFKSIKYV